MKFSCKKINIKNKKDCSNGDTLVISTEDEEKVVCGKKKKFVFTSTSDMVVEFTSNGKKAGAGAKGCKVTCSQAAGAATTTTTTTTTGAPATASTGAPTTTTEAPTTTTTAGEYSVLVLFVCFYHTNIHSSILIQSCQS